MIVWKVTGYDQPDEIGVHDELAAADSIGEAISLVESRVGISMTRVEVSLVVDLDDVAGLDVVGYYRNPIKGRPSP